MTIATRKPSWIRQKLPSGPDYARVLEEVRRGSLHTVCESAKCPNIGECWSRGTATFMILGDVCTRACGFCAVKTGRPGGVDQNEPVRVADAVRAMGLSYIVLTSVDRDDLGDGGAGIWAETIRAVRRINPGTRVETLIPDFQGDESALRTVVEAAPDVLAHNVETVPSLYRTIRARSVYTRSLDLLSRAKDLGMITKTSIMLGLGETAPEIEGVLRDIAARGVPIMTIGQYLQPTSKHLPVKRWAEPEEFAQWKRLGESLGIRHIASGPMVRSSYFAETHYAGAVGEEISHRRMKEEFRD